MAVLATAGGWFKVTPTWSQPLRHLAVHGGPFGSIRSSFEKSWTRRTAAGQGKGILAPCAFLLGCSYFHKTTQQYTAQFCCEGNVVGFLHGNSAGSAPRMCFGISPFGVRSAMYPFHLQAAAKRRQENESEAPAAAPARAAEACPPSTSYAEAGSAIACEGGFFLVGCTRACVICS